MSQKTNPHTVVVWSADRRVGNNGLLLITITNSDYKQYSKWVQITFEMTFITKDYIMTFLIMP